jgi:hypothetical protein
MNRQFVILSVAVLTVAGYLVSLKTQDTLPKAADRLGQAVISSDIDTLWSFVPKNERSFYNLDKEKFRKYWNTIVQPHVHGFNSIEFDASGTNGIEVVARTSRNPVSSKAFSLLVSGQNGDYYVPYFLATAGIHAVAADISNKNVKVYQRFELYSKWVATNKARLTELGFSKIRRGPLYQCETLDEMENRFRTIAKDDVARTRLAQR